MDPVQRDLLSYQIRIAMVDYSRQSQAMKFEESKAALRRQLADQAISFVFGEQEKSGE